MASDEIVIIFETIEEFMEMLGIVIFVYALLDYMCLHLKQVSFHIGPLEIWNSCVAMKTIIDYDQDKYE